MSKNYYLLTVILAVTTMFSINLSAQTKTETAKGEKIFINKKGEIHDHGWTKLGFITKDNIIKNNQGKVIYFIDADGNVNDAKGKNLGKAKKNGNYYNSNGENVITVRDIDAQQCEILDPKGHSLGTVHRNYKLHACAAHCYFLEQKKVKSAQLQ